jgi:hypothetical protein
MVYIANTLFLETFWVSEALLRDLKDKGAIVADVPPVELRFTDEERLLPFPADGHTDGR